MRDAFGVSAVGIAGKEGAAGTAYRSKGEE